MAILQRCTGTRMFRAAATLLLAAAALQGQNDLMAKISFKRVIDSGTGTYHAFWTPTLIDQWVADINDRYVPAGIAFVKDEVVDIADPGGLYTSTAGAAAHEALALASPALYAWRTDAINIYLVDSISGAAGQCSFSHGGNSGNTEILLMGSNPAAGSIVLAHELGHYFDLYHTHQGTFNAAASCADPYPSGAGGDGIWDTPEDPQNLATLQSTYGTCTGTYERIAYNIMSYYSSTVTQTTGIFTPGQISKMRETAIERRRHVLTDYNSGPRRGMITEVRTGPGHFVELTNFKESNLDLTGWRIGSRTGPDPVWSATLSVTLAPGEVAHVVGPGSFNAPAGVTVIHALQAITPGSGPLAVALADADGVVRDEVRIEDSTGAYDQDGLGGYFAGLAPRVVGSGAFVVERIWGLDSDGGSDWTAQPQASPGYENASSGPRGTDPRPLERVLINEVDDDPDFVELRNVNGADVELRGWTLRMTSAQGGNNDRFRPWSGTDSLVVPHGGLAVIGENLSPPAELPAGVPFVVTSEAIVLTASEYEVALYDVYGRLVDLVRTTAASNSVAINFPRSPSAPLDFLGAAGRSGAGDGAIARLPGPNTGTGLDWGPAEVRTMGMPNNVTAATGSTTGVMDVRVNDGVTGSDLIIIMNAGPAHASHIYTFAFSVGHLEGTGSFLGLDASAYLHYVLYTSLPPFTGTLDARGSARITIPGVPTGFSADLRFALLTPQGALVSIEGILEYDT